MRSRFSVEWLSQSSGNNGSAPVEPWSSTNQRALCASSTLPESLPGFYCSKREVDTQPEERPHASVVSQCPEAGSHSLAQVYTSAQETGCGGTVEEVRQRTGGSESKGGSSLSLAAVQDSSIASTGTGRRPRTAFTTEQINQLEKAFKRNVYLGTHDKAELCKKLNLSDKQIRNWFQNRRMKLKRTYQDSLTHCSSAKLTSQLVHLPDLQAFGPSPYPSCCPMQKTQILYQPPSALHYTTSPAVDAMAALPVDPLCQLGCIPNLTVTPGGAPHMSPYHPYYRCY